MGPCLRRHRNRRLSRKRRCDNGDVVADQIGSHLRQTIINNVSNLRLGNGDQDEECAQDGLDAVKDALK
jgi:hypothetical protein